MEPEMVIHQTINSRYRVVFEQSAVKGVLGYKVEANGDNLEETMLDAARLQTRAAEIAPPPIIAEKKEGEK